MSASPSHSPRRSVSLSRASEPTPSPQVLAFRYAWIAALSFQYGYHIASLNGLLNVLSHDFHHMTVRPGRARPGRCIAKADQGNTSTRLQRYQFGLLTSIYAPGGLLGSLVAGTLADQLGRKRASLTASAAVGVGSLMMAFAAPHLWILLLGR